MPRIAFYSHDTFGLGHLRRCLKLAWAIESSTPEPQGLLMTGSAWAELFSRPSGFALLKLPSVVKRGQTYAPRRAGWDLGRLLSRRRRWIAAALEAFRPDLLVVDNVPCGLLGEMLPSLRALRARSGTRCVLALRDVLDQSDRVRAEWSAVGAAEALETLYDEVWVFGDGEAVSAMADLPGMAKARTIACGRIGLQLPLDRCFDGEQSSSRAGRRGNPSILVVGGGGGDAAPLVGAYVEMLRQLQPPVNSRIVLGPDFPRESLRRITFNNGFEARFERFIGNLPAAMAAADVVISMAGYNTVCELEAVGSRAILVPRVWPRQEQLIRARDEERRGRASLLLPEELQPHRLWQAVEASLERPSPSPLPRRGETVAARRAALLLGGEPLPEGA